MINDVTLDLSHATIEAEALEFEDAVAMERLPHAEMGGIDGAGGGMGGGTGGGMGGMNGNGAGPVSEHPIPLLFDEMGGSLTDSSYVQDYTDGLPSPVGGTHIRRKSALPGS